MRVTLLLFALLGMVTLGLVRFVGQYEKVGPELLGNDWVIPKRDTAFVKSWGMAGILLAGTFSVLRKRITRKSGLRDMGAGINL